MSFDVDHVREREFPWTLSGDSIYLNNASIGPYPARTVRAVAEFNTSRATPYRITQEQQFGALATARAHVARLIGADTGEIAIATNTSYGIILAALALPLKTGDVVLGHDQEFPANVYPWMALELRGVEYRRLPLENGIPSDDALIAALDDERVKAVAISWVEFASGYRFDLARIGAECRRRGVYFVVDGIQGVGAAPIDVHAANIDILACGAQKWLLSPWGSGFVYVRRELARELDPPMVGWMAVRDSDDFTKLTDYDMTWRDDARKFEQITLPYQDVVGMNASLELMLSLGAEAIAARVESLAGRIIDWACDRDGVRLVTPADPAHRAGIVSFKVADSFGASAALNSARVAHSLREGAIRLSPHFYNTKEEIEQALRLLGG